MPSPAELRKSGVKVATNKGKEKANPLREALEMFATAGEGGQKKEDEQESAKEVPSPVLVQMGCGLPALSKKLLEKIEAEEYINFTGLPPAMGKGRSTSQAFEGQIVVVHAP